MEEELTEEILEELSNNKGDDEEWKMKNLLKKQKN